MIPDNPSNAKARIGHADQVVIEDGSRSRTAGTCASGSNSSDVVVSEKARYHIGKVFVWQPSQPQPSPFTTEPPERSSAVAVLVLQELPLLFVFLLLLLFVRIGLSSWDNSMQARVTPPQPPSVQFRPRQRQGRIAWTFLEGQASLLAVLWVVVRWGGSDPYPVSRRSRGCGRRNDDHHEDDEEEVEGASGATKPRHHW